MGIPRVIGKEDPPPPKKKIVIQRTKKAVIPEEISRRKLSKKDIFKQIEFIRNA